MVLKVVDLIFVFDDLFNSKLINLSNSISENCLLLGKENIPHLSLCKFVIDYKNLNILNSILSKFILENKFPKLFFDSISIGSLGDEKTTAIILEQNNDLLNFQNKLVLETQKFNVDCTVLPEMFFENVNDLTINWTQNAVSNIFRNYNPHVSVGFGNLKKKNIDNFNFDFIVAEKLVISHMGNYCSSKKFF